MFVYGDYVIAPIKNAFNDKISYWISKKHYSVAYYCFSVYNEKDAARHLDTHGINAYISYFDHRTKAIR